MSGECKNPDHCDWPACDCRPTKLGAAGEGQLTPREINIIRTMQSHGQSVSEIASELRRERALGMTPEQLEILASVRILARTVNVLLDYTHACS